MSMLGALLAFLAPAVAARSTPAETPVDDKSHPRFVAGYEAGLKDGRRIILQIQIELERVRAQRDAALDDANRALQRAVLNRMTTGEQQLRQLYAQAFNGPLQQHAAYAMQMQAQSMPNPGMWPSCTPSRSDALTGRRPIGSLTP